jgi:hypothetical protein
MEMSRLDPEEPESVASAFNIATQLAQEIVYENDDGGWRLETPEQRYVRMLNWVRKVISRPEAVVE